MKPLGLIHSHVRGVVSYTLSPFAQNALAGIVSKGVPNMWRRFRGQVLRVVPRK